MSEEDTKKVITLLRILPAGVQKMSREIEGLVQTSLNLGVLESKEDGVSFLLFCKEQCGIREAGTAQSSGTDGTGGGSICGG